MHWRDGTCDLCPEMVRCRDNHSGVVVATPCNVGGLLAIGEAPGADEDAAGMGFVGDAGKSLRDLLKKEGLPPDQYGVANICRCRPPNNRAPHGPEINNCLPFLASLITTKKPRVILAVGGRTAARVLCGPGTLHAKLDVRSASNDWSVETYRHRAHRGIREALKEVPFLVPMPHTSPRVFNLTAPDGVPWAEVAERQVKLAVRLLKLARTH